MVVEVLGEKADTRMVWFGINNKVADFRSVAEMIPI